MMIEILSILKLNAMTFDFYYRKGNKYHSATIARNGKGTDVEYLFQWRDRFHFAGVIGKFNPYSWFAPEPYKVKDGWGYKEIKEAYDYFNETYWGGTGSPWEEENG